LKHTLIFFIALMLISCTPQSALQLTNPSAALAPLTRVNMCYSAVTGSQSILWYTFEKGFFKKNGLDVHLIRMSSGVNAVSSLAAGENDFCIVSANSPVNAIVSGIDVVMIAGLYNVYTHVLMVAPTIQTPADLKGKLMGISDPGSTADNTIRIALRSLGLDPDKDVTLVNAGNDQERLITLQAGRIDGTVIIAPNTLIARQAGFHAMVELAELNMPYLHTGVATTRSYLAEHRSTALNFMRALCEAIAAMKNDPTGAKEVMAKYFSLDVQKDAALLEEVYAPFIQRYLEKIPYPNLEGLRNLEKEVSANNPAVLQLKTEDVFDLSLLKELESDGLFHRLYP
jgi:NitT/TauT family transport system substrate-binding protein